MGDLDNFGSYVVSLVCRFIRNIWTISIVIFPPFDQNSVIENPIRVVIVLADNFEEGIRLGSDSNAVVPLSFEVAGKLKGANIKGSGGLIREWILIVHRGIWSWEVFFIGGGICDGSIDHCMEDWISIVIIEGGW